MAISVLTRNAERNCRRNCICYKISCKLCLRDGRSKVVSATYVGESRENMHCRAEEHLSKFNSGVERIKKETAFLKPLENTYRGRDKSKEFHDNFEIEIMKAYSKSFIKCVEEGTYIANPKGDVLN